jgi:hypothetical protein
LHPTVSFVRFCPEIILSPHPPDPAGRWYETCVRLRTRSLLLATTLYYIDARVRTTTSGVSTTFRPDSRPPRATARFLAANFRQQRVLHDDEIYARYFPSACSPREVSILNTESGQWELLLLVIYYLPPPSDVFPVCWQSC